MLKGILRILNYFGPCDYCQSKRKVLICRRDDPAYLDGEFTPWVESLIACPACRPNESPQWVVEEYTGWKRKRDNTWIE